MHKARYLLGSAVWDLSRGPFLFTGGFIVLDGETFELKGNWENECDVPPTGYDFWYQPCHNVLVSSAGLVPKCAGYGFDPDDFGKGEGTGVQVLSQNSPRRWELLQDVQHLPLRQAGASSPAAPQITAVSLPPLAGRCHGCPCL